MRQILLHQKVIIITFKIISIPEQSIKIAQGRKNKSTIINKQIFDFIPL